MSMSRLLYASRCALEAQGGERLAEVRAIAENSALANIGAELSGCLLYVDDVFIQVLEGPKHAIERVFEAICCDMRHEDVKLIDFVPVRERLFAEWSMAFLEGEEETVMPVRDDLEEIRFLVGVNAREALDQMRQLLVRQAA